MKKLLMNSVSVIDSIGRGREKKDAFKTVQERRVNGMSAPEGKEEDISQKYKISCKTDDIGLETFLICLEKKPKKCKFSILFGNRYFCKKPFFLERLHKESGLELSLVTDLFGEIYPVE